MGEGHRQFIPTVGGIEAKIRYLDQNGQPYSNILHYQGPNAHASLAEVEALAAALAAWQYGSVRGSIAAGGNTLVGVTVLDISQQGGNYAEDRSHEGAGGGDGYSGPTPVSVAACVRLLTNQHGHNYRGDQYFSGVPRGAISGRYLDAGYRANLVANYTAAMDLTVLTTEHFYLSVLSLTFNKAWRASGLLTRVTGIEVKPAIATQRRRLRTNL